MGYIDVYWGYNPFTDLLLTSWDILVPHSYMGINRYKDPY